MEKLRQAEEQMQWESYLQPFFSANYRLDLMRSQKLKAIDTKNILLALTVEDCQLTGSKLTKLLIHLGLH